MTESVQAKLNYSLDNGRPIDYYFYDPDPALQLNPPGTDVQQVSIENGWPRADNFSADREGFEIRPFEGSFVDYDDDAAIKSVFYAQVVDFVRRTTGAKRVVVFDHTIRRRLPPDLNQQTTVKRPAVMLVHSDYTPKSGVQRVRDILADEAEGLLAGRVAFYNVWKSLYETVEELPLAMCDSQSSIDQDMLLMELKYRERTGEIYVMRYSPEHKWVYFPNMTKDQALLLKTYDSETDGRARFMGHTAFEDPTSAPDAPARQSIEIRTMAFFLSGEGSCWDGGDDCGWLDKRASCGRAPVSPQPPDLSMPQSITIPDLAGKAVLITGASTGIGAALAQAFAAQGALVGLHYHASFEAAQALAKSIEGAGGKVFLVSGNAADPKQVEKIVGDTASHFGRLDGLINNAGGMLGRVNTFEADDAQYDAVMDLNARSVLVATRAAVPWLKKQGGFVIHTTSIAARNGGSGGATLYAASKGFVSTLTHGQAKELIGFGIRVNAVAPGVILTPFHERYSTEAQLAAMKASIPQGRLGTAEDCVGAYLFLASNALSGYIIGQVIEVNGGQLMP